MKPKNKNEDPAVFFSHRASGIDQSTVIMTRGARGAMSTPESIGNEHRYGASLSSIFELPFVYKRLIIVCVALSLVTGWVAILVWPQSYESEAKLMIRVGRESVSLDPTATTSKTLTFEKTQEEEIVSALEVLGSRQISEDVVDVLGDKLILSSSMPSEGASPATGSLIGSLKDILGDVSNFVTRDDASGWRA